MIADPSMDVATIEASMFASQLGLISKADDFYSFYSDPKRAKSRDRTFDYNVIAAEMAK